MAFWKVPVTKTEYSFVVIESECEPTEDMIVQAAEETLSEGDWVDTEYESDEDPFEVNESFACQYEIISA